MKSIFTVNLLIKYVIPNQPIARQQFSMFKCLINSHPLQPRCAAEHLWIHEKEGQQKTAPVAEATVHTLDHRRLERRCLVMSLLWHLDGTVWIWHNESIHPALYQLFRLVVLVVWWISSWHILGPLVPTEHHLSATAFTQQVSSDCTYALSTVHVALTCYYVHPHSQCHWACMYSNTITQRYGCITTIFPCMTVCGFEFTYA